MNRRASLIAPDFERLFSPASVAIVGASANSTSISGQPMKHLRAHRYEGRIFPVNPRHEAIDGLTCYPSLQSLPETPDVAIIAVAARHVPSLLEQCGERGVAFAVILSSGFAEAGPEGAVAQSLVQRIAQRYNIRVIGPNCQGMMNIADDVRLGFGAPFGLTYRKGPVSLVSQSGAFGNAVLMLAEEGGLGFRRYLSTGNESCTTSLDVIESLIADDGTSLIAAYVEGFKDAHRLIGIARSALTADKPILMWKVGNSVAGAKAAASHTANLGGTPALYRAAFRQSGILEIGDIDDLTDCAHALLTGARPAGNRVAVLTLSGGAGIAMADRCEELGLNLPTFSGRTLSLIRPHLPDFAAAQNPLDLTAGIGADVEAFEAVLQVLAEDPDIDLIGLSMAATSGPLAERFALSIARVKLETGAPMLVAWNARLHDVGAAYDTLHGAKIPRYPTPARCVRGIAAIVAFAQARRDLALLPAEQPLPRADQPIRWRANTQGQTLTEYESKLMLASCGLRITREVLANRREQAVSCAVVLGGPVALKVQSPDLPHKTEAGGVELGLQGAQSIGEAFDRIVARARAYKPDARIDGVLVQEMVPGAVEVIIGATCTPQFGPTIMFGLGGVYAELLNDVAFRIIPIVRHEAMQMIRQIKAFGILDGARGRPAADIDALCDALMMVANLIARANGEIAELDINPLFVLPKGQGVIVGDALIRRSMADTPVAAVGAVSVTSAETAG